MQLKITSNQKNNKYPSGRMIKMVVTVQAKHVILIYHILLICRNYVYIDKYKLRHVVKRSVTYLVIKKSNGYHPIEVSEKPIDQLGMRKGLRDQLQIEY